MKKRHDHFFKKAKQENYAARSVYKLEEAQKKFSFLKKHDKVLDVGTAPGSWAKYVIEKVAPQGKVVGIDLLDCKYSSKRFTFIKGDFEQIPKDELLIDGKPFDAVISDAMPNTTQDKDANHHRSIELVSLIRDSLDGLLKTGGAFFVKVFDGGDFPEYKKSLEKSFAKVKVFKPKSSRDESRELFVIGQGFKEERKKGG